MVPKKKAKQVKREEKKSTFSVFFTMVFTTIFVGVAAVLAAYFFVIPSVLESNFEDKNIVIISNKLDLQNDFIYFAHISQQNDDSFILRINSDETVTVPGGYGEYPLQSVYPLLKIDKKDDQFIRHAYSQLLGLSVDEVIALNQPLIEETDETLKLVLLKSAIEQMIRLEFAGVSELLQVHYRANNLDKIGLDQVSDISEHYSDLATISGDVYQYCSVAVINATEENGVATEFGELIETTGGLVVRLDDAQPDSVAVEGSVVMYYSNEPVDCSQLTSRISGLFSTKPVVLPISELENNSQYRAKVVILIRAR